VDGIEGVNFLFKAIVLFLQNQLKRYPRVFHFILNNFIEIETPRDKVKKIFLKRNDDYRSDDIKAIIRYSNFYKFMLFSIRSIPII
jgi:hypothetical protein